MAKEQKAKKDVKKKPLLTQKEKKAQKNAKKAGKEDFMSSARK